MSLWQGLNSFTSTNSLKCCLISDNLLAWCVCRVWITASDKDVV